MLSAPIITGLPQRECKQVIADQSKEKLMEHLIHAIIEQYGWSC